MSCLQLKSVEKRIGTNGQEFHLGPVDLSLDKGKCLALVGTSGCGKTSLLKLIAGFEDPDQGEIVLGDDRLFGVGKSMGIAQRKVGYVFQEYALFPHLKIRENLQYGQKRKEEEALISISKWLKIEDQLNKYPHELSGGQQQRVAIGRSLLADPQILLLDEPLSNIDEGHKVEVRQELRQLIQGRDLPAILVSHDLNDALAIADYIAIMVEGKIQQIGTAEELFDSPNSIEVAKAMGNWQIVTHKGRSEAWRGIEVGEGDRTGKVLHSFYNGILHQYQVQLNSGDCIMIQSPSLWKEEQVVFGVKEILSF